jgi:hypothetical protein
MIELGPASESGKWATSTLAWIENRALKEKLRDGAPQKL